MKPRGRQMMAWLLTAAVTLSGNSFTVLADEMDVQVQQETTGNEEVFAVDTTENTQDEVVDVEDSAEISFDEEMQDEIQIEDTEDSESEEEMQTEEFQDGSEDSNLGGSDDISVFSSEESENPEEKYLPQDQQVFWNEGFKIDNEYDANGENICVKDISIENIGEEADPEEIICEKTKLDAGGWFIFAETPGKVKITLSYTYNNTEKEHSFEVTVKGDRYIVEQQLPSSGKNMFKNSEQSFPFVLHHEWRYGDENQGSEELENWELAFSPNEDGVTYIKNLLTNVTIEDHTVTVSSGSESAQTDIYLKAVFNTEDGQKKEVPCNLTINIVEEYDVLYPESLDIAVGETLNLNDPESEIRVEHVKEGKDPYDRDDVTYEVEYNKDQWENSAEAGQFPILKRMTNEGTGLTIIAKDEAGNELCRRNYQFDIREYPVWFEDLREGEYSTSFFDNENGELRLNTEELEKESEGKEITVSWEAGYREAEQNGDSFTTQGIPNDLIFWSETSDKNVLAINGDTLSRAYKWLEENMGGEFWFEVRAHIKINGAEACMAGAAIHTREAREDYWFPVDEVILCGEWTHVEPQYNGHLENKDNLDGTEIETEVTNVSVANAEDETDETSVCTIKNHDEYGWDIYAERPGKATVTITYKNINKEEKTYTYTLQVSTDKYILEPQWGLSESNMLKNSSMEIGFILRHQWMEEKDGDRRDETVDDWSLEFAPDEENQSYNTNVLKNVIIDNEEKKITVESGTETVGTDIFLKALISSEDGVQEEVTSASVWIEVCDEYDVMYPEKIENLQVGGTLNLNESDLGLRVEHIKEGGQTEKREDITLQFDYDEEDWKNITQDEPYPVLQRATSGNTWLNIRAVDADEQETCHRYYEFEELNYNVYFEDLRDDDYSTYFYDDEDGELTLNTEDLDDDNTEISWEVGYRTENDEDEDSFVKVDDSEAWCFWTDNSEDDSQLSINGAKLKKAYEWLREKKGENFWFEARAHVKANGVKVCMAQAGINIRDCVEDYELPEDETLLKDEERFINKEFNCWVENAESPEGEDHTLEITTISVENEEGDADTTPVCEAKVQEDGWSIIARRYGTAVITLEYKDLSGNPQEHSFRYSVNSDRYTLEPQWGVSEGNMLRNSEMELGFVMLHDWKNDDDERYGVEVKDWELALAPDDNNWSYDTNLLNEVTIKDGKTLVIKSGEGTWETDILLKAMIPTEDGNKEEAAFNQVRIEVCETYDILYPTDIANLNVGETLDPEKDLKAVRITDDGEEEIKVDHYDVEYDSNQWDTEEREGRLPLLKRKSADNCWLDIIAIDEEDNEIRRHYEFEWLDYSVWFENLRDDSGDYTFAFEDEQYELSLNTENLDERGVKDSAEIIWSVGYAYTDENGEDIPKTDIPEEYTFWSENPEDNSKLIIDSSKLTKAYAWLHTQISGVCWFEIRAGVELGGVIVSEEAYTGLGEVCKNEEEYYINFGVTLNMVPGDTLWIDDFLEGSIRDKDHPYGEDIRVDVTKVSVDDTSCCRVAYQGNGWSIKALKCGTATLKLVYTDYHGKQQSGEYTVSVQDETYWMNYNLERSEMLPGETKEFTIRVYRATKDNLDGEVVDPAKNKYSVTVEKCNSKDPIEVTADENGKITINVDKNAKLQQSYGFDISVESEARDEEGNPIWSVDGDVYVYVMERYPDKIQLEKEVNLNPALGDIFDINEYKPTLLRYNPALEADNKWEALTIDNRNFKFVLDWDESVWTEQDKNSLPVLKRTGKARGAIVLRAEEYDPDSEEWYEIARDSYYVSTIFDKDAECSHIWETIVDEKGNCGKAEKRHQICTACQKTELLPDIPATGRHTMSGWKVTKQANALTEGMKEQTCTECGLKQQQSIPKLTATLTLNVPENKTLPMKMKQTYQLKASGLADGDKVVSWTSSNKKIATVSGSGKLKALKKKGKTTITVKLASGKTAKFTVKVQKADVATTSLTVLNKATGKKMPKTVSLKVKKKLSLTATVAPVTSKQKVTYSTSNKSIATVNAKGVITAKKKGTVTITVKSGRKKVKVKVKVTK